MFRTLARPLTAIALGAALFAGVPAVSATAAEAPGVSGAMPGPGTTGVPAGVTLTPVYGDVKITVPGTVIDGKEIFGLVRVEAANVVIKNTIIRGRTVTSNSGLIYAGPGTVNLQIQDVELAPQTPQVYLTGIYGSNFTLRRADIHHVVDAVHIFGDNVRVFNSWLHDLSHFDVDAAQNGGPTHDDDIQIQKGTDIWIKDNVMSGSHNAAIQVTQGQGAVSVLLIENNVVSGGGCTYNIAQGKRYPTAIARLMIRDNLFGASKYNCNVIIDTPTKNIATITNNARTDGKAVRVNDAP